MTNDQLMRLGLAAGVLFAIYHFVPNQAVKAMALGVGGVIAAKTLPIPYVTPALTT